MPVAKKRKTPLARQKFDDTFEIRHSETGADGVFAIVDIVIDTLIDTESFVWLITDLPELDAKAQKKLPQSEREQNERVHAKTQDNLYAKQYAALCNRFRLRTPSIYTAMKHLEPPMAVGESIGAWITRVLKINGWQNERDADGEWSENTTMLAMYKGSKFNHSCKPTLNARLILESRSAVVKHANTNVTKGAKEFWVLSVADIKQGDEVTVTYLSPAQLRDDVIKRRSYLKEKWGFDCLCVKCKDDLRDLAAMTGPAKTKVGEAKTKVDEAVAHNFERLQVIQKKRAVDQTMAKNTALLQRIERMTQRHAKMTKENVGKDIAPEDDVEDISLAPSMPSLPPSNTPSVSTSPMPPLPVQTTMPIAPLRLVKTLQDTVAESIHVVESMRAPPAALSPDTMQLSPAALSPDIMQTSPAALSPDTMQLSPATSSGVSSPTQQQKSTQQTYAVKSPRKMSVSIVSLLLDGQDQQFVEGSGPNKDVDILVLQKEHNAEFTWYGKEICNLRKNNHVFILLSCMIAIRVRYKLTYELEFEDWRKRIMLHELHYAFQQYYSLLLDICSLHFKIIYLPYPDQLIDSYDDMFLNEVLCKCVAEMTKTSLCVYDTTCILTKSEVATMQRRMESWVHVLNEHKKGIKQNQTPVLLDAATLAARPLVPPEKIYIQMPSFIPYSVFECLGPEHSFWIEIMLTFYSILKSDLLKKP